MRRTAREERGTATSVGAVFLVSAAGLVAVLGASEALAGAAELRTAALEAVGLALHAFYDYAMVAAQTALCVSAALLYVLLYLSRRVPRWLSLWGLAAWLLLHGLQPTANTTAATA